MEPSYNSVLQFGASLLLGVTGFFLKSVASDLKEMKRQQVEDGNRITALEAITEYNRIHQSDTERE
jgi:hypothetical protein